MFYEFLLLNQIALDWRAGLFVQKWFKRWWFCMFSSFLLLLRKGLMWCNIMQLPVMTCKSWTNYLHFWSTPPLHLPPPPPPPPPHSSTTSAHGIAWKICSVSESGRLKFDLTTGKLWGLVHRRTVAMARTSYGCDCNLRPPTCIAMQKDQVQSKDHGVQVKVQWIVDPLK